LLVEIPPGVTEWEELALLLVSPEQWGKSPFAGIFVTGTFPMTSTSEGGYRVIPLKEMFGPSGAVNAGV